MYTRQFLKITNTSLRELAAQCFYAQAAYEHSMQQMFSPEPGADPRYPTWRKERIGQLRRMGVRVRNHTRSFYLNRISPGCLACPHWYRNGYLLDVTHSCNRKCFFCYHDTLPKVNYPEKMRGLRELYRDGRRKTLSIGNSEPLLAPQRVFESLRLFRSLTRGKGYTFLYTNGDLLTPGMARELQECGLDEIRFSIKPGESNFKPIRMAQGHIPHVMVEMPVFPGDEPGMRKLLVELDRLDVFGINLSHLLFTSANRGKLKARGYKVVAGKPRPFFECVTPFELSAQGSEEACFNLLEFAADKRLKIGVHYCSNENFRTSGLNLKLHLARKARKPYETVTKYGLLKKLVVCHPDHLRAQEDLRRRGVPAREVALLPGKKRLETHINNLPFLKTGQYEVGVLYSYPDGREVDLAVVAPA